MQQVGNRGMGYSYATIALSNLFKVLIGMKGTIGDVG